MSNALSNARHPGESHENYRARRKAVNRAVSRYLQGRQAFISTQVVQLPKAGVDTAIDELVRRREYRDLTVVFFPDQIARTDLEGAPTESYMREARVGRTKGTSHRLYPVGRDRREWRKIHLAFSAGTTLRVCV